MQRRETDSACVVTGSPVASYLDKLAGRRHLDSCRVGLVGVDVHLGEGVLADTNKRPPKD